MSEDGGTVFVNTIRHQEALPWAKDYPEFMAALQYAMAQTAFIVSAHGKTAEQLYDIWWTIQRGHDRLNPTPPTYTP